MVEYAVVGHSPVRDCVFVVLPSRWKVWLWLIRNLHKYDYVSITVCPKGEMDGTDQNN